MLRDAEYEDETEDEDDSTTGGPLDTDDMMEDLYGDGDEDDEDDEVDEAVKQAWGGI